MLKVTLRQIGYFVAAAETGSIAEAARIANVAQPSVSWAIQKMEELLGVELFIRQHARGVSLTAAGHRLLPQARSLLRMA
ncbi:MAG: LysR family transcriptional regulator, partial [Rhodobacteraceae bacterium]|nr:LysR family transcriptional regulator [Paracoccaceae bacterium]